DQRPLAASAAPGPAPRDISSQTRTWNAAGADATASRTLPELARGKTSTLGHGRELGPHDVGIDRRLTDPGADPAVGPRNDVLASDQLRVARDALSHQLGMLDEVGGRVDDAGDQHPALRPLAPH